MILRKAILWLMSVLVIAVFSPVSNAQTSTPRQPTAPAEPNAPLPSRPKSFDIDAMDRSVDPCVDFYQYACGAWRQKNPIPPDQSRWGRFNELAEYNRQLLHQILERAANDDPRRSPVIQKIGDFYHSCMDEAVVNAKGASPLKPELDRIASLGNHQELIDEVAALQKQGVRLLFVFRAQPNLHNASMEIADVSQGGLGLPDRQYYLAQDPKSKETRENYVAHIGNMFTLLGEDPSLAKKQADAVMAIETKLAEASLERVEMRDPKNRDHKMKVSELASLAPNFQFPRFFRDSAAPKFSEVNVVPPNFFQQVNEAIPAVPLEDWKAYLKWHLLHDAAGVLSHPFVNQDFDFYGRYLNGQKELQARWKRCVRLTDSELGEALGQPYVQETFGAEGKQRMLTMVAALEKALADDIQQLPWMTAETKKQAEVKLKAISNKIGYPDKWRDYSTVRIERDDLVGNVQRADEFEVRRVLNKIGRPLDKNEWNMTPPTVNAYYSTAENDINFPAGILQPPFFDKNVDEAVNYGGIGVVIGHELTHGFDDQGSKFDAQGNFTNWWTPADRQEFDKRTSCIADEYSSFIPVDDIHLNGRLTLGENTADNGGTRVAFMALAGKRGADPNGPENKTLEGFTPEQRFFLGFAQVWCENRTPESEQVLAKTDPHSPGRFRVLGTIENNEDFAQAFHCKPGQPMTREKACRVW